MKLLETRKILTNMLQRDGVFPKEKKAIMQALIQIDITIENGDESNL